MNDALDAPLPGQLRRAAAGGLWRSALRVISASGPYLYVLPALVLFGLFLAFPVYTAIDLSLRDWSGFSALGSARFIGLANFGDLLNDELFWLSLKNTVVFTIVTTVAQMAIGFVLAFALWYYSLPFAKSLRALIFFPSLVSMVIIGLIWREILSTDGLANNFLSLILGERIRVLWFGNARLVLWTIIWIDTFTYAGWSMVLWLAGMMDIPKEQMDAARIDGAGVSQLLRYVVLPGTEHVASLSLLLNLIGGFQAFAVVYVTTRGGPAHLSEVLSTYVFYNAFYQTGPQRVGYASAIATLMVLVLLVFSYVRIRQSKLL